MGMFQDPIIIPVVFLFKGIMSNIYNVGIAFVYTFCSKDNLKIQFTTMVIITTIFNKVIGMVGTWLYELTGQSFFKVNCIVALVIILDGIGFMFLYEDK